MLIGKAPLMYTTVPLQKNLAKALIESGVFDHGPSKVVWALPATPPVDKAGSDPEVAGGGAATQVVLKGLINAAKLRGIAQAKTPAEALGFRPKLRPPAQTGSNTVDAHIAIPAPAIPLPVTIPRIGELQPVKVPRGSSKKVERAFGVAQAVVPLTHQIGNHPVIGVAGDSVVGLVACAEIVYNLVSPKDRTKLEAVLFYGQKATCLANSIADFVPALQPAKPYLQVAVTLIKVGDSVRLFAEAEDKVDSKPAALGGRKK